MTTPYTQKDIVNLGLAKITSSFVSTLTPPVTPIERRAKAGYAHWRDTELAKRRWVFAWRTGALTQTPIVDAGETEFAYRYAIPQNARMVRERGVIWQIRDGHIYSNDALQRATWIAQVTEDQFDPLFVEVLACRVAKEMMRSVPLDVSRSESVEREYKDAVRTAGVNNAIMMPSEEYGQTDDEDDWIVARETGMI